MDHNEGLVGRAASGWLVSGTTIVQSGPPFTVSTNAAFAPLKDAAGNFTGYAPGQRRLQRRWR